MVGSFWWFNWQPERFGRATEVGFFFLWLGYIVTVDAIVAARAGDSILRRSRRGFLALFAASIPAWWLFEYINGFLGNWEYLGLADTSRLEYGVIASLSFSTVMPAVFETAELAGTALGTRLSSGPRLAATPRRLAAAMMGGLLMMGAITVAPTYSYPAAWLWAILALDPALYLLGWPSIWAHVERGDWRLPTSLALGALVCGFFWEMWNFWSFPKWQYHIPFLGFGKIFEMPLLGYGGYLPFGLELYVLYQLMAGVAGGGPGPFAPMNFLPRAADQATERG